MVEAERLREAAGPAAAGEVGDRVADLGEHAHVAWGGLEQQVADEAVPEGLRRAKERLSDIHKEKTAAAPRRSHCGYAAAVGITKRQRPGGTTRGCGGPRGSRSCASGASVKHTHTAEPKD